MNWSCHAHEWIMSHIWTGHVTRMNESCYTCDWVMSHIWMQRHWWVHVSLMGHVTWMNGSCHAHEWVMSHINEWVMSHIWVIWHIWMGHVTHLNGPCHTFEWVMSQTWMQRHQGVDGSLQKLIQTLFLEVPPFFWCCIYHIEHEYYREHMYVFRELVFYII